MVSNVLRKPKTAGSYILLSDSLLENKKFKENSHLDLSSNGRDCNNKQRQVEKYTRLTPWGLGVSVCDKHADGKFTAQKGQNYHTAFRSGSSETSALRFIVQPTLPPLSLSISLSLSVSRALAPAPAPTLTLRSCWVLVRVSCFQVDWDELWSSFEYPSFRTEVDTVTQ